MSRRPRLTAKVVAGLNEVWNLAYHAVQGEERFPPSHPVWSALAYILDLVTATGKEQ